MAVLVAQLVEVVLRQPEISSLNPVIGIYYLLSTVLLKCFEKTKKRKRGREWPNLKSYSKARDIWWNLWYGLT